MNMNYEEACAYLRGTLQYGSKPGLARVAGLCEKLANPQAKLPVIHVTGTNGKGSTCAMLASVLRAVGYKTGLFLSPYLEEYRDSLLINGEMISPDSFAKIVSRTAEKAGELGREGEHPTEFEILTAAAFLWFWESRCDAAVVETGMGGRLDATNILKKPAASVITSISLDHTAYLGDTLAAIAEEKCGIIKQDGITVTAPEQNPEALAVIEQTVKKMNNRLVVPDMDALCMGKSGLNGTDIGYRGLCLHVPLNGRHQVLNALTAVETALILREHALFAIPDEAVVTGIANARIAARQEVLLKKPLVLLDGAHNPDGVDALVAFIRENLKGKRLTAIMGMLKDKPYEACIGKIAALCERFIAVAPENPRALGAGTTAGCAKKHCKKVSAFEDYRQAFAEAMKTAGEDGAVIICGSLYLAGPMRGIVKNYL